MAGKNAMPTTSTSISAELMHALRFGGLQSEQLGEIVKTLDGMHQKGLKIGRVLTKGIPPVVDAVVAHAVVDRAGLSTMLDSLGDIAAIESVVIFPIGIPQPEVFQTEITVR